MFVRSTFFGEAGLAVFLLLICACGDAEVIDNCADCPDPDLQLSCLDASNECEQFSGTDREQCLEEARAMCE
ncbi:MAG: hypothetical protein AAF500_00115 [Myxococcota bacterium]